MERTLVILKPDAVQRGIVGEVISRFEKVGLKLIGMKMVKPSEEHYFHHYETIGQVISRRGQEVFDMNLEFMMEGPVIVAVLEGVEAISLVRKMVGTTEPKEAAPGTIRGDFTHMSIPYANNTAKVSIPNVIHASGDAKEAKQEIEHWFSGSELFEYQTVNEGYTQKGVRKKK